MKAWLAGWLAGSDALRSVWEGEALLNKDINLTLSLSVRSTETNPPKASDKEAQPKSKTDSTPRDRGIFTDLALETGAFSPT